jgi:hypothetical protein
MKIIKLLSQNKLQIYISATSLKSNILKKGEYQNKIDKALF